MFHMESIDASSVVPQQPRRVIPDELTDVFREVGLHEGNCVIMHASLSAMGQVEGGAAMVLHRLLGVLGKQGTLLMPTFTSVTRHSSMHEDFTKPGCWCQGQESRHLPFIAELQPDKEIGEIAHRLCSWPSSRRSRHPAFSYVAVGRHSDELVKSYSLDDPLQPLAIIRRKDPFVLTIGVGLEAVVALHLAEQPILPHKFRKERALTISSTGPSWVDVVSIGCNKGFQRLQTHVASATVGNAVVGSAITSCYSVKRMLVTAKELLRDDPMALSCERAQCLSCRADGD